METDNIPCHSGSSLLKQPPSIPIILEDIRSELDELLVTTEVIFSVIGLSEINHPTAPGSATDPNLIDRLHSIQGAIGLRNIELKRIKEVLEDNLGDIKLEVR